MKKLQDVVDQLVAVNPNLILSTVNGETNEDRIVVRAPQADPLGADLVGAARLRKWI